MRSAIGSLARLGATAAVCAGSVGIAIVAFPLADYRTPAESRPTDETVAVLARTTRETEPSLVELVWSERRQITNRVAEGTVTDIFISADQPIECGLGVVEIDGAGRVAMCGSVPPWRSITASTEGKDAEQLADLLVDVGLLSDDDRSNGWRRMDAWRELTRFVGLPTSNVFEPSDVVWIGDETTPSAVLVEIGDTVSADTVLLEVEPELSTAVVRSPAGESSTAEDWVFSVEGSPVEFGIGDDGSIDDPDLEAAIRSTMTENDAQLPRQVQGVRRLSSPVDYAAVPPSALVTDSDGSTCVVLESGRTTDVTVVESVTGLAMVEGDLAEGTAVVALPPAGSQC